MHLQAAMFERLTGTRMNHIPYKELTQAFVDISRHELGWAFTTGATGGPLVRAKKLKFLAVASPQRHPAYREVPTLTEAGGPALDLRTWVGLLAPRGVPKAVVDKINADLTRVLSEPDVRDQLIGMAFESWATPVQDLSNRIDADINKYGDLMKKLNLARE